MSEKTSTPEGSASPAKAPVLTKIDAVRQAMAKLGKNAKPLELQSYIKKEFGIEMTADHVSTSKGDILRKKKAKGKAKGASKAAAATGAQPAAAKPVAAKPATATTGNGKTGSSIGLEDIAVVKGLVGRVGPEQLRSLVDLLAK